MAKESDALPLPTTKMIEAWRAEKKTPAYAYAAACVMNHWAAQFLVTEEQYDAGIKNQPTCR